MGFSSLALDERLLKALQARDYSEPTPIQAQVIPHVLEKQDVLAGAQTGTGKTAAFVLPILQQLLQQSQPSQTPKVLILAPTRELAVQVFESVKSYSQFTHIQSTIVYGGVSIGAQVEALKKGVEILVATPGRLIDHLFKGTVDVSQLSCLVFDEADRMLDMGFIDEINMILKRLPKNRQTLLFSATLDDSIFALSKSLLKQPKIIETAQRNAVAEPVEQIVYNMDSERKREFLSYLIGSKNWQQVLVFTRTKQGADALAKEMNKDGLVTQSIHGDKSQGAREKALKEFKSGKVRVLVATDVAARGLDIRQLNYVVNYELPYIAEDYVHRIGRTGRAGDAGLAISLLDSEEHYLLEEIEALLDTRLNQQWFPGYEPDLTKESSTNRKNSKAAQKRRAKQRAFGQQTGQKRRRS
ncbi:DEAD/DEAH box helicase [Oceaniserpentilla sp. 4NH20-0058]|uniref:DEAD/DEAH box helicase n=1 Tax=Oceaniserpentilla sp. 4NH20-0058 TaxID=3127660 RepID=UPI00310AD4A9